MTNKKIIVVGGGIAGMALALFLKRDGFEPVIYESRREIDASGVGIGLAPNGMAVLRELGLAQGIRKAGSSYSGFRFLNSKGEVLANCDDQTDILPELIGVGITRQATQDALLNELRNQNIQIVFEKKLERIETFGDSGICHFSDGTVESASIIVAADGLNSSVRRSLMPEVADPIYTGLKAFGGFIDEGSIATAHLPPIGRMDLYFGHSGFFGLARCGLRDKKPLMMWWNATPAVEADRNSVLEMTDHDRRQHLLTIHRNWCAPVEAVIERSLPGIYSDNLYDMPHLPVWSKGRVILIGDAGHAVSPHSGQGASLALEDAWTLSEVLSQNRTSYKTAFQEFERRRRSRVEKVSKFGSQSAASKKKVGPLGYWLRDRLISSFMPMLAKSNGQWLYKNELTDCVERPIL